MNSSMSSQLNCPPFQICSFINITSAYIGVADWGWWGAMAVTGKKYMRKLDSQMGSNETLLCLKHHKKQPNQQITTTANSLPISANLQPSVCLLRRPQLFQGHPSNSVYLTNTPQKAVPAKADLFTFSSVSVVVSQLNDKVINWQ